MTSKNLHQIRCIGTFTAHDEAIYALDAYWKCGYTPETKLDTNKKNRKQSVKRKQVAPNGVSNVVVSGSVEEEVVTMVSGR